MRYLNHFKRIFLLAFAVMLVSCGDTDKQTKGYVIKGNIEGAPAAPVYLEKLAFNQNVVIDTAIIASDGSFEMRGVVDEKGMYMLKLSPEASWVLVLDNEVVEFSANAQDIFNYKVDGPEDNRILMGMVKKMGTTQMRLMEINQEFQQVQQQGGPVDRLLDLQQEYLNQTQVIVDFNQTFADTVSSDLLALFAITLLDVNEHYPVMERFVEDNTHLSSNSLYRQLKEQLSSASPLATGREAPDFTLTNHRGDKISLSQTRGKIVYLNFWASWCGPCRRENPNLVRLYEEFGGENFTIFSISLDNDMSRWVNGIREGGLNWSWHGSELKGWGCSVARKYQISGIPTAFLIDEEGRIVGRNIRGMQLENKLRKMFSEHEITSAVDLNKTENLAQSF